MSKRHEHRSRSRLSDVAERAGVSAVTVSRAIRHPEMVTPKLRKRIEKAIDDLAYVPNRAASVVAGTPAIVSTPCSSRAPAGPRRGS